jgi:ubiquinone/menaquinone biosynthesis C-methylase UbiE
MHHSVQENYMKNDKVPAHQALKKAHSLPPDEEGGSFWSDCIYTAFEKSTLLSQIFREVYGAFSPEEDVCPLSFVTKEDLENCVKALELQAGMNLLDLACGGGGPGLWIARKAGANLVGIDFSVMALEQAVRRASQFGMAAKAKYCHGSMKATGLESGTFDGVVSIDALWMAPDKQSVLQEVRRLMRPQGRFVFTTWEGKVPGTGNPTTDEYRSLLQASGFKIETYEETANWEELQREVYGQWLLQQQTLAQEMGVSAAGMLVNEAIWLTTKLDHGTDRLSQTRRIFVVCRPEPIG